MNGETLTTIIGIFLAAILIGMFPMMAISERNDDIAQLSISTSISEFVDTIRKKGVITTDMYDALVQALYATGNTYDISM